MVVTAVNDLAVDSSTWLEAFRMIPVPFNVTFDARTPLYTDSAALPTAVPAADGAPPEAMQNSSRPPVTTLVPSAGSIGASSSGTWAEESGGAMRSVEPDAGAAPRRGIPAVSFNCAASGKLLPLPTPPAPRLGDTAAPPVRGHFAAACLIDQASASDRRLLAEMQRLFSAPAAEIEAERRVIAELWGPGLASSPSGVAPRSWNGQERRRDAASSARTLGAPSRS